MKTNRPTFEICGLLCATYLYKLIGSSKNHFVPEKMCGNCVHQNNSVNIKRPSLKYLYRYLLIKLCFENINLIFSKNFENVILKNLNI